jgi:hypothetical protein
MYSYHADSSRDEESHSARKERQKGARSSLRYETEDEGCSYRCIEGSYGVKVGAPSLQDGGLPGEEGQTAGKRATTRPTASANPRRISVGTMAPVSNSGLSI